MPAGPSVDQLGSFFDDMLAAANARNGHMVVMIDARAVSPRKVTPLHRKRVSRYFREISEAHGANFCGQVFLVGNPLQRGLLTAVTWIFAPPWPRRVVTSPERGEDAARELLGLRAAS